jgi:C_GCAxxG_C_C family probable redox protein
MRARSRADGGADVRTVDEAVEHAMRCWEEKHNCAESALRGVCYAQGIELCDQAKQLATPFGGGIGRSQDVCGALTGGVLGIGAALGRTEPSDDKMRSYDAAGVLYRSFLGRFGSVGCSALNRGDFTSPEHRPRCGGFVAEATRLAVEAIRAR